MGSKAPWTEGHVGQSFAEGVAKRAHQEMHCKTGCSATLLHGEACMTSVSCNINLALKLKSCSIMLQVQIADTQ